MLSDSPAAKRAGQADETIDGERPLSVCLLNDAFPPQLDGVATAVLNYAKVIESRFGKAVVSTPSYPGAVDDYPFPVVRYPSFKMSRFSGYRTGLPVNPLAFRTLAGYHPDVLHCHCPTVSAVVARTLRRITKAPIIMTYHTKFDIDIANAFESQFMRGVSAKVLVANIEACDEVWAVSKGAGENLEQLGFRGTWRVMENGVDFPRGGADPGAVARLRCRLGVEAGQVVLLFVGRMFWYKGLRIVLDGLAKLKAQGVGFKMVFVGDGVDYDDVVAYAQVLGLAGDCVFAGAETDRARLREYFSAADMFLLPSTFDNAPVVVKEAAACGLASVLIAGSSAAEGVEDGRNGVFIDGTADSLAAVLGGLADHPERMRSLGAHAMNELYLSWEDSVARARQRYLELLDERRAAGLNHR